MNRIAMIAALALIALMLLASTLFIVDQRQFAVIYALGEIKSVISEPGLKVKLPPPFQNVVFLDRRIQTLDSPETRPIFTAEKKSLVIDWLVKWRIVDARQFIRNNGIDIRNLENRLSPIVQATFNEVVTKRTIREMLSTERDAVMQEVKTRLADEAKSFGIEIVDVRIKRVDFSANITDSVYRRMESERKRVANELRSTGAAEGDAQRFASVLAEYQKAPAVTRDRLYIDTMQQIYASVSKVLIDLHNGASLLNLPLDKLLQSPTVVAPPVATPPAESAPASSNGPVDVRSRDGGRERSRERETR